ncbi:MAG: phosphate signaling complex protein PhoU [Anaerohalosphaeraceae bacterium]|nr:phosphate signaling complex protein PhoU [Anaerohalosphaeraceae bacterium]
MPVHLKKEIENLKKELLTLCGMVEDSLFQAVKSIKKRDVKLAEKVIDSDIEIDRMEVKVEEDCLKVLALHQPVAIDLRFIITALKINNDLERIGDLAVSIAENSRFLSAQKPIDMLFDFETMAEKTQAMVKKSLDALVNIDCDLASQVCEDDDEIDAINRQMYDQTKRQMKQTPENIETLIHLLSVSRHLERIADHATNIAEDVIYMVKGEIVRHNPSSSSKTAPA